MMGVTMEDGEEEAYEKLQGAQTLPGGVCFYPLPPGTQHPSDPCSFPTGQPDCQMPPESNRVVKRVTKIGCVTHDYNYNYIFSVL